MAFSLILTTVPSAISFDRPDSIIILKEYEKLINSFTNEIKGDSETVYDIEYPYDYAGAYYGDDGYLHICLTSSDSRITFYTGIVDESLSRFDFVNYTFDYLMSIHNVLKPNMANLGIYDISTIQADNKVYIYVSNSIHIEDIESLLDAVSVNKTSYEIIINEGYTIVPCSGNSESKEDYKGIYTTNYFRPGDPVYNWSSGSGVSWATVLCNARKTVNGSYVYGFITAAHLWWDCTSAGNSNQSMATISQATTNYNVDATFIPFNDTSFGATARIYNYNLYPQIDNYLQYYFTSGNNLENYPYEVFGKGSGHHDSITIVSIGDTYTLQNPNNNTVYTITGIKTTPYSSAGDSGGPFVYKNEFNTYTLLGMTSAKSTVQPIYNWVVPIYSIFSSLNVTMMGGNY